MSAPTGRGRFPEGLVRLSVEHPLRVLALWAIVLGLAAPGVLRLRVETSTDSVLNTSDAAWRFYQHSQERFGGDEIIVVAIEGSRPYDPAVLSALPGLTQRLLRLPGVRRVDSLGSVPAVRVGDDEVVVLDPPVQRGDEAPAAVAAVVAADRVAPRSLVSDDGSVFALNVVLEPFAEAHYAKILSGIAAALDGRRAWISGVPVFRTQANERTTAEIATFVPLTIGVIGAFLLIVFRSLRAAAVALATSLAGALVLLGVMGALGTPLTITTMVLPSIVLALGCAYVMHLLTAAAGVRDAAPLQAALRPVALPVMLSGLTTAIGFAAIAFVRIDAIRFVGGYGALGAVAVLLLALTAAPALLRLAPLPAGAATGAAFLRGRGRRVLLRLADEHRSAALALWLLAIAVFGAGVFRVEVETDVTRWFPPGNPVRDSYEAIGERLSGISPMNVLIESRDGARVTEPAAFAAVDGLRAYLESLPGVGKALSYADPVYQLHQGFAGAAAPAPASEALVEQYLLLLESVEQLGDLVTDDRLAANVVLRVDDNGSAHLLELARQAESWWAAHGPAGFDARGTGIMYEFARAQDEIALGQLRGLLFALIAIAVILVAIVRWVRLAALALLPNALPVLLAFGWMGLAGIPLDAGTVLVGSLALGIAIDDTIHVVSAFSEGRAQGLCARAALDAALERVLPALVYTTVAIGLGFAVLALSTFTFTRNLGLLTSGILLLCLVANVNLLPALLLGRTREPSAAGA